MKHSRRKTGTIRRVIKQASICLLLGAIVNVAVAWGVANLLAERSVVTQTISGTGIPTVTSKHYWPVEKIQGWPMASFSEEVPRDENSATVTVIEFKNAKLAYGLIWRGFVFNTIFFGVILWMLFFAPFMLRRWRRIRRGLCTKCGYDLRGEYESGCSECGWNRIETEKLQNENTQKGGAVK